MAQIRIYLLTYKRNALLPRAIQSLLDQTFTDWICELHNDCPEDNFPGEYIQQLTDKRFILKRHPENLGSTASFNLAFSGCNEEYVSILEDDNWWEATFLQEMVSAMIEHPNVSIAWSNTNIWREKTNGSWEDTKQTTWPVTGNDLLFTQSDYKQAMGALHSNGSMLYRSKLATEYIIPANCDFNMMEAVRERCFKLPILLKNKVLSNFSQTLQTSRPADRITWTGSQIMLLSSFIAPAKNKKQLFKDALFYYRSLRPSPIATFFLANIFFLKDKRLYSLLSVNDWLVTARWLLRNGYKLRSLGRYLKLKQNIYDFLVGKAV